MRYLRQSVLPGWGAGGQARLTRSRVLLVGLGGLGSIASLYLAAAGIGTLVINDFDTVDETNLHRQLLYGERDVGQSKTEVARTRLLALNSGIRVEALPQRLTAPELEDEVRRADLVLDTTDHYPTRYDINRLCVRHRRRLVGGSCIGYGGQLLAFDFRQVSAPCYACLYPEEMAEDPMRCGTNGVSGPVTGVLGSLAAQAVLDLLIDRDSPWPGFLWRWDARTGGLRAGRLSRDPACPVCRTVGSRARVEGSRA